MPQPAVVQAVLKDETQKDSVPVWPILDAEHDHAARFSTASFLGNDDDEQDAMTQHLKKFPKPALAPPRPEQNNMPRMVKPSHMTAMHQPLTQQDIERVVRYFATLVKRSQWL